MIGGSQHLEYVDVKQLLNNFNQEYLFNQYTGLSPSIGRRYYSIFRTDKTPGCRFEWRSGVLYFIDNAGFNGQFAFNIVSAIQVLYGLSFKQAIHTILRDNTTSIEAKNFQTISTKGIKERPEIRIKFADWKKTNYFDIDPIYLSEEHVYLVTDYWIKIEGEWKHNSIHNPKNTLTIAYYFPHSRHIKLYFPQQKEFRWYSSCDEHDIFGMYKLDYYLERDNRHIIITKSQKDRLLLDYVYGYNVIAVQSEGTTLTDESIKKVNRFKSVTILYDNDHAGQKAGGRLAEIINGKEPRDDGEELGLFKEHGYRSCAVYFDDTGKDVYGIHRKYGTEKTKQYVKNTLPFDTL